MVTRRNFIKSGLIFVPTVAHGQLTTVVNRRKAFQSALSAAATAALNDWVTRVQGQGSDVTIAGTQTAVLAFIQGLLDDGVWSKIVRMGINAGDGLNALKAPLKNGGSVSPLDTLNNFDAGDYSQSIGLAGNGTDEYITTGINWNDDPMTHDDIHIATYTRTRPATDIGVTTWTEYGSPPKYYGLIPCLNGTETWFKYGRIAAEGIVVADPLGGIGMYIGTRTSVSSAVLYKDGISVGSDTTNPGGSRPVTPVLVHGGSSNNSPSYWTAITIEMYSVGLGLTATDAANLTARYNTLRNSLGRTEETWSAKVVRLGGAAPSAGTVTALETFHAGLVSADILKKMIAVNAFVPDNLTAACVPYIKVVGNELWTNNNFISGDLTVNGLKGNGSSTYLDTGIAPTASIVPSTNFGATVVMDGATVVGTEVLFGSVNSNGAFDCVIGFNGPTQAFVIFCDGGGGREILITPPGAGYSSGNRLTTTDLKLYFASQASAHAQVGTASVATYAAGAGGMFAFAGRHTANGNPYYFTNKRISFMAIHLGLTSAESAAFYALVAALRTSLGGGNP
jgi:hypothetical protein